MNRIILIGNGFDLAHKLKTSFPIFIADFWQKEVDIFNDKLKNNDYKVISTSTNQTQRSFEDDFIIITLPNITDKLHFDDVNHLKRHIKAYKNNFLKVIEDNLNLNNWVDIEEAYYKQLIKCLKIEKQSDVDYLISPIKKLNDDFHDIQNKLEDYLCNIQEAIAIEEIKNIIYKESPEKILFLSFNYTNSEKLYADIGNPKPEIIHIHGELRNTENKIIFGYGDEIADDYGELENINNNNFLENSKSVKYLETINYDRLLEFIKDDSLEKEDNTQFEVYILGHSCGTSDRTLLNTLFEHKNCKRIKIFYHKDTATSDNYSEISKNISRIFTKKSLLRKRVEKKEKCDALIEYKPNSKLKEFLDENFVQVDGIDKYKIIDKDDAIFEKIDTFFIGKYPVTQKFYKDIMGYNPSYYKAVLKNDKGKTIIPEFIDNNKLPVTQVSWYNCLEFCNILSEKYGLAKYYNIYDEKITINKNANGFRLPTEAEWEYAARSGQKASDDIYKDNNDEDIVNNLAWHYNNSPYADCSERGPHPIGEKEPNLLGLFDMRGNVCELV